MNWRRTWRADPRAARIADRHYSRGTIGAAQFTPPGRVLVLVTLDYSALWCTSAPFAEYVHRAYPGAWVCSLFRNEGPLLSSTLITEAVAATRWAFDPPPPDGMITLINVAKAARRRSKHKPPGVCYQAAGFVVVGETVGGLLILQLLPAAMPPPTPPLGAQLALPL